MLMRRFPERRILRDKQAAYDRGDLLLHGCQSSARSPAGHIFTSFGSNWPRTSTRSVCAAMTAWMSL